MNTLNFPTVQEIAGSEFFTEPLTETETKVGVVDNREAFAVGTKLATLGLLLKKHGFKSRLVNRGAYSFLKVERDVYRVPMK